jgi:predicted phosphohydrolase
MSDSTAGARPVTLQATADLHYNIPRSRQPAERIARRICDAGGDALVLVGDTAGAEPAAMADCLGLFESFPGRKLLVPGNHCLWCRPGEDSLTRYHELLPAVAAEAGFTLLDHAPQILDGRVGLVGSIGWYDFAFRDESLEVPLGFYRAKLAPGAATYYTEHRQLVADHRETLTDDHLAISTVWKDGRHVNLPMSDEAFTELLCDRLAAQLDALAPRVERIVAFTHHVPFEPLVPRRPEPKWAFAAAFLGSPRLGRVLLAEPKVSHVLCGHTHWPTRTTVGPIEAVNIGSTYTEKRLETLTV